MTVAKGMPVVSEAIEGTVPYADLDVEVTSEPDVRVPIIKVAATGDRNAYRRVVRLVHARRMRELSARGADLILCARWCGHRSEYHLRRETSARVELVGGGISRLIARIERENSGDSQGRAKF